MLVKVKNKETNQSFVRFFDTSLSLRQVRQILTEEKYMNDGLFFLYDQAVIDYKSEEQAALNDILDDGHSILIGKYGDISLSDGTVSFYELSQDQVLDFFKKKQLYKGLVFSSESGVTKSFSDIFTLTATPSVLQVEQNTMSRSAYAFSKEAQDIALLTSKSASLALNTPYASGKAGYEHQKKTNIHKETVTEYMMSEFIVSLMKFRLDADACVPTEGFVRKVNDIITSGADRERKVVELMGVLGEFGLYIPLEFTMGGALYACETTEICEFTHAESEKESFSASADAEFSGFSSDMSFFSGSEEGSAVSSSQKYKNIEVRQIGGLAGNTDSKEVFKISLDSIANWAVVDITEFYPSLLLLANTDGLGTRKDVDPMIFIEVQKLLASYSTHSYMEKCQPYINMRQYMNTISALINPL